jgi:hypothetical protein
MKYSKYIFGIMLEKKIWKRIEKIKEETSSSFSEYE